MVQWIKSRPKFSSDYTGNGPASDEYDLKKYKASNKKRANRKALLKWGRKRTQGDSEDHSSENYQRTKSRRAGLKVLLEM